MNKGEMFILATILIFTFLEFLKEQKRGESSYGYVIVLVLMHILIAIWNLN